MVVHDPSNNEEQNNQGNMPDNKEEARHDEAEQARQDGAEKGDAEAQAAHHDRKDLPVSCDEIDDDLLKPDKGPFHSMDWQEWLDLQAQSSQGFAQFQRECELPRPNPHSIVYYACQIAEVAAAIQHEASLWVPFMQIAKKETM